MTGAVLARRYRLFLLRLSCRFCIMDRLAFFLTFFFAFIDLAIPVPLVLTPTFDAHSRRQLIFRIDLRRPAAVETPNDHYLAGFVGVGQLDALRIAVRALHRLLDPWRSSAA